MHSRKDSNWIAPTQGNYTAIQLHDFIASNMSYRRLRRYFDEDIIHDLVTSSQIEVELEAEWQQLKKDRDTLRTTFPKGNNKVSMQLRYMCNDC